MSKKKVLCIMDDIYQLIGLEDNTGIKFVEYEGLHEDQGQRYAPGAVARYLRQKGREFDAIAVYDWKEYRDVIEEAITNFDRPIILFGDNKNLQLSGNIIRVPTVVLPSKFRRLIEGKL